MTVEQLKSEASKLPPNDRFARLLTLWNTPPQFAQDAVFSRANRAHAGG